nr:DUF4834 family protein [Lutibacter sp. Hel_I_33_5]
MARLFAPFLMKKVVNKMQEKASQQNQNQQRKSTVKEGETVIDTSTVKKQQGNNKVGEYVDFEEIE